MKYFAMIDGERRGPFELNQLAEAGVRPSTYVWCKDMDKWEKAEDVADVCRMFRNRIYDLMHPSSVDAEKQVSLPANSGTGNPETRGFTRYDRVLQQHNADPFPSIEEIEERENKLPPPPYLLLTAILVTILFFPPTGIAAIVYAVKARKTWKEKPASAEAGHYTRSAKMWIGITFFLGLIFYAFISRF